LAPPAGATIAGGENPRFTPTDKPMIVRGFMPGTAGMRGIAIGTPGGMHFAFDSERCALSAVWTGEFAEIGGWYDNGRGRPEENGLKPLGKIIWRGTSDKPFREAPQASGSNSGDIYPRFRSISASADGTTVAYDLPRERSKTVTVEETWKSPANNAFERTFAFSGDSGSGLWLVVGGAPEIHSNGDEWSYIDGDRGWIIKAEGGRLSTFPTKVDGGLKILLMVQPSDPLPNHRSLRVTYRSVKPTDLDIPK